MPASIHWQRSRVLQCRHRDTFLIRPSITQDHVKNLEKGRQSQRRQSQDVTSPVFRLPAETMAEIFEYNQLASYDYTKAEYKNMDWCWITITHVCKHWRDIAIATQGLWTYINTGEHASVDQTAIYLERSGISPLVVNHKNQESHFTDDKSLRCLLLALGQFHRIRELSVYIWKYTPNIPLIELEELLPALTRNTTPTLQAFSLSIFSEEMLDTTNLFAGEAPRLKKLALHINAPFYAAPVMRNLKSLLIAPISTVVALQDVFSILQENSSLEEFRIQSPLSYVEVPHLSGPLKLTISPIQLSYLKELTLHCAYYEQLRSFFQNVTLPEIISWDIVCLGYPIKHQDADPRSIIPSISGENSQCTTLELQICYRFVTINSIATGRCDDNSGSRRFSTYSWEDEAENFEKRVTALECISFIYSVIKDGFWRCMRTLRIEIEGDMSYSASPTEEMRYLPWIRLLETLPYLEELACRHVRIIGSKNAVEEMHFGLLRALARTHKVENGKVRVICPNLSVLRLCGMDFEFGLVHLVQSLTERGLNWSRLPKLELDKPFYMTKVTLRSLKESDVVGVIEVIE